MFTELINAWELIFSSMQGLFMVLVAFFKPFVTTPLVIFLILGLISFAANHRIR